MYNVMINSPAKLLHKHLQCYDQFTSEKNNEMINSPAKLLPKHKYVMINSSAKLLHGHV